MATYNFTIRATDNAGAYSDRAFNLTVNNTIYDRYVAVGNAGLVRSPDAVNWTWEPNLGGNGVQYGGGRWLVYYPYSGNLTMRTSADGTSWSTYTPTFTGGGGPTILAVYAIKYRNGAWVGIFTSSTFLYEYSSTDGNTWTQVTNLGPNGGATDFDYDAAGTMLIYNVSSTKFVSKTAAGVVTQITPSVAMPGATVNNSTTLKYYNGTWFYQPWGAGSQIATSVDMVNWVNRSTAVAQGGLLYVNGRMHSIAYTTSSGGLGTYASTLAGRSWAQRSASTNTMGSMQNTIGRQPLTYFGGTMLMSAPGVNNTLYKSTDEGVTYTTVNLSVVTGSAAVAFTAVASRDGLN